MIQYASESIKSSLDVIVRATPKIRFGADEKHVKSAGSFIKTKSIVQTIFYNILYVATTSDRTNIINNLNSIEFFSEYFHITLGENIIRIKQLTEDNEIIEQTIIEIRQ